MRRHPLIAAAIAVGVLGIPAIAAAWPFPPGYEAAYKAYLAALPPAGRQLSWLTKLDEVVSEPQSLTLAGKPVVQFVGCKAHDCEANRADIFLAADHKQVAAVITIKGVQTLVGGAGPAEIACVQKLKANGGVAKTCP